MRILVACEYSGTVRDAFARQGHDAWSCDILPTESEGNHYQGDILQLLSQDLRWDLMIAHPPCTHLAVSGARWFKDKKKEQEFALQFVQWLLDAPVAKICLEKPVSIISTKIRKPTQIIQPWQFGHAETKTTCLWLKGLPKLIPTNIVEPDYMRKADGTYYRDRKGRRYSKIHFMSRNNPNRAKLRSLTYQGIADAMAEQWGDL